MKKKPIYEQWSFWVAIGALVYLISTTNYQEPTSDEYRPPIEDMQSFDTTTILDNSDIPSTTKEERMVNMVDILSVFYEDVAVVSYDPELDAVLILPTDFQVANDLTAIGHGYYPRDIWDDIAETVRRQSTLVADFDPSVRLILLNPTNTQGALLITQNGEVTFDVIDEMEMMY